MPPPAPCLQVPHRVPNVVDPQEPEAAVDESVKAASTPSTGFEDYRDAEQRKALYRVLARNMVRELRAAGHEGRDLLAFVGELMEAISETGFDRSSRRGEPPEAHLERTGSDPWGRPTFAGDGLILRPPMAGDGEVIQSWLRESWVQHSLAPGRIKTVLAGLQGPPDPTRLDLLLCPREPGPAFGMVSLEDIDPSSGEAELGKVIGDPAFRGKGLAGIATVCLLRHGFESLGLRRVVLRTLGGNVKNIHLNERIGFRFEGVLTDAYRVGGEWRDIVVMALLRRDFQGQASGEIQDPGLEYEPG